MQRLRVIFFQGKQSALVSFTKAENLLSFPNSYQVRLEPTSQAVHFFASKACHRDLDSQVAEPNATSMFLDVCSRKKRLVAT